MHRINKNAHLLRDHLSILHGINEADQKPLESDNQAFIFYKPITGKYWRIFQTLININMFLTSINGNLEELIKSWKVLESQKGIKEGHERPSGIPFVNTFLMHVWPQRKPRPWW
jgi:hypothetical protein